MLPGVGAIAVALPVVALGTANGRHLFAPFFRTLAIALCRLIPQKWLFSILRLSSLLPVSLFSSAVALVNQPSSAERTWMKSVKSVPAKGTWFAPDVASVTDMNAWSIECNKMDAIILWIHGGGFCFGTDTMYSPTLIQLVNQMITEHSIDVRLFSLDYGLAPKHKFPNPAYEALQCYRNMLQKLRIPACKIIIAGDSCGGGLAVSLLSEIINESLPLPRGAVLVSPWVSMDLTSPSYAANVDGDYLGLQAVRTFRNLYLPPDVSYQDPRVSPIFLPSFQYFPPMMVVYGSNEVFQHDIEVLIKKLKGDGVEVHCIAPPKTAHVWMMLQHLCESDNAWISGIKITAEWCAKQLSSSM